MTSISPKSKICYNCKYLSWLIGVGQGLKCGNMKKREEGNKAPSVPSRFHTCDLFEFKTK
jgi:hypothetical protein